MRLLRGATGAPVAPGAVAPGAVAPGAVAPGAVAPGAVAPGALGGPEAPEAPGVAGATELSRLMSLLRLSMRLLRGATLAGVTGAEATGVGATGAEANGVGADLVAPGHLSWNLHKTVFILVLIMSKKEPLLAMTLSVLA